MGIQYTPGATRLEVIDMFRLAAERGLPVYTHVRSAGRVEPGSAVESVSEVIGAAAITGAALHIVHINSSCLRDSLECLAMVEGARARGLDVTTEAYPYIAGMTAVNSALFNPGWREKLGIDYGDLVLPDTGEHLTKERFDELHKSNTTRWVLVFANTQEIVDKVIPHPLVMIASDGAEGHPRNAGTYSRVLAQYVRGKGTVTLMDAIRKMSLMPAEMLERSTPTARQKGRLQEGADADIVVFDAAYYQRPVYFSEAYGAECRRALFGGGRDLWWWTKVRSCRMCFRDGRCWGREKLVPARGGEGSSGLKPDTNVCRQRRGAEATPRPAPPAPRRLSFTPLRAYIRKLRTVV